MAFAVALAFAGWITCAGSEALTRVVATSRTDLAGVWAASPRMRFPGTRLRLGGEGGFAGTDLPVPNSPGARRSGTGEWTAYSAGVHPGSIRLGFADGGVDVLDIRRSWRGQLRLVLWIGGGRGNKSVTFVRLGT